MKLSDALDKLDREQKVSYYVNEYPEDGEPTNYVIAREVGERVLGMLGSEWFVLDTFDNCREWGLTYTVPGWQFCVYEHRNSDQICMQGCPIDEIDGDYGPWPADISKYDVLSGARWQDYGAAANYLVVALRYVNDNPEATRDEVKAHLHDWAWN